MKRLIFAWVVLILSVGGWVTYVAWTRIPSQVTERPFTDLKMAAAKGNGWEFVGRPEVDGPYRYLSSGGMASSSGATYRVRDDYGTIVEEIRVPPDDAHDHVVVFLETPSGQRTMALLRRSR